jgi:lauroyl/myristoyl acyltransferase
VNRFSRCAVDSIPALPEELRAAAEARISIDASLETLAAEARAGRGIVLIGPHTCGFLLAMARINQVLPLTVYLRYSRDARKRLLKEQWCRVSGLGYVAEESRPRDAMSRVRRMTDIVESGGALYITPDLPQERGSGKPVRWLQRGIHLPPGGPLVALRSRAPLYLLLARPDGARVCMTAEGPFAESAFGGDGGRVQAALRRRLQWFADAFGEFVRRHPELWYFWADKRWTRVFRNDPRYAAALDAAASLEGSTDPPFARDVVRAS